MLNKGALLRMLNGLLQDKAKVNTITLSKWKGNGWDVRWTFTTKSCLDDAEDRSDVGQDYVQLGDLIFKQHTYYS